MLDLHSHQSLFAETTLLIYEMMAKEMGISLRCPNHIDISRLRPEKEEHKNDAP